MHLQTQAHPSEGMCEYTTTEAKVMAKIMHHMESKVQTARQEKEMQLAQTYSLQAALKRFKSKGKEAAISEMKQLDDREVYTPIKVEELTQKER